MPKNINNKSKPKASNAGGDANKEKDDTTKINTKPHKENKPKSDILQHNGTSAPNINSWAAALNNPEVFSKLELTLPWSSSLFKEGLDISKIKRPTLIGGEPVRPVKNALGEFDPFEEKQYWIQMKKRDTREGEERLVFDFIQAKQSPQSLAVVKQDLSYEGISERKDIVEYLKLVYRTHLINVSNPIQAELSSLRKFTTFRQFENQSTLEYFESFRKMMEQLKQSVTPSMVPSEPLEAWTLLMGMGAGHSQLKQTLMSNPVSIPRTVKDMQDKIIKHIPLEVISQRNKSASAFATSGNPTNKGPPGKKDNGKGKGKDPTRDCDYCVQYHPDYPNKNHWKSACPNIEKLILERHAHNIQSDNDSSIQSQSQSSQQQSQSQHIRSNQNVGLGLRHQVDNTQQSQSQHIRSNQNVGLGLRHQVDNTAGGGRGFHIIASISNMSMLESYSNIMVDHKQNQILDPQSQVAIFNREDLVTNIRDHDVTLTLHGMGNGSLVVNQIADHPVLGEVWFHQDAAINVWQMRATECACNVELVKEFDRESGCKVTTAFLATDRNSGAQYRFNYVNNLYVLDEGRH